MTRDEEREKLEKEIRKLKLQNEHYVRLVEQEREKRKEAEASQRDEFAKAALIGMISNDMPRNDDEARQEYAHRAGLMADAMMKAREVRT